MTFDTVITDSHVLLPSGMAEKNIVIDDGKIVDFTTEIPQCNVRINARGLVSIPGVIDPHVHYGVYSPIEKAAITESRVAAIGGVTTMMRMLRLGGSYKKLLDSHLSESSTSHYTDYKMCSCGIREGKEKKKDGLGAWSDSRSVESEIKSIRTISKIARKYGCVLYFVHIGSQGAMDAIKDEKKNGTKIFVETCPHYLTLSYESQKGYLAKVMPPIRTSNDVDAIWKEIQSGTVNSIGTDHVANRLNLKLAGNAVWDALAGFPGMGTMLPILISEGVNKGRMTLEQLVSLTSINTAKIFGMFPKKGSLQNGSDADITIIDLKKENKVSSQLFGGFSDYTVYEGWNLKGWPVKTLVRGEIVAEDFEIIGKQGYGKFVTRPVLS